MMYGSVIAVVTIVYPLGRRHDAHIGVDFAFFVHRRSETIVSNNFLVGQKVRTFV